MKATAQRAAAARPRDLKDAAMVRSSPFPVFLFDFATSAIVAASQSFAELVDTDEAALVGQSMWELLPDGSAGVLEMLAEGGVAAEEVAHPLARSDGSELQTRMWVRAIDSEGGPKKGLVVVSPTPEHAHLTAPTTELSHQPTVIGTVDDQLRVDRISFDVDQLLARPASSTIGRNILSIVHPDDSSVLLSAVGQTNSTGTGVAFSARVMRGDHSWLSCDVLISPLPKPPRFGFVLCASAMQVSAEASGDEAEQEQADVDWVAHEEVTSPYMTSVSGPLAEHLQDTLSIREMDIVMRLASGKRVPAIASDVFLTKGTVRNHLSSAYRKLGLHNQQELLDLFHQR